MQIDKSMILDLLRQQGRNDDADRAQQELPDQLDHERDSGLLQQFGLDPQELLGKLGGLGGIGKLLG